MGIVRLVSLVRVEEAKLSRFVIKSSIAGGIVYYTVQEGLWSKPEDTIELYGRLCNTVAPYVKKNVPEKVINEIPQLPSVSNVAYLAKSSWNKGVVATMKFIAELPTHASNGFNAIASQPAIRDAIASVKGSFGGELQIGKTQ